MGRSRPVKVEAIIQALKKTFRAVRVDSVESAQDRTMEMIADYAIFPATTWTYFET